MSPIESSGETNPRRREAIAGTVQAVEREIQRAGGAVPPDFRKKMTDRVRDIMAREDRKKEQNP